MLETDWQYIKFFKRSEFRQPELVNLYALQLLDYQREKLGVPIFVTSDARPPAENKLAGGVDDSLHQSGEAFDTIAKGISPLDFFLKACEVPWTEIGLYEEGFVHLGSSGDNKRRIKRFYGFSCPFCNQPGNESCLWCKGHSKIYKPISETILVWHLSSRRGDHLAKPSLTKKQLLGIP